MLRLVWNNLRMPWRLASWLYAVLHVLPLEQSGPFEEAHCQPSQRQAGISMTARNSSGSLRSASGNAGRSVTV